MATRHELIHIDFVANAGKANPVMKSLQTACDDTRVAKEKLDKELANAKAAGASAKVIADIEGRLKAQTKTLEALQKGMREYTKGIDTLSKGIKEFNQGTLDQMSAKFNKSVYNAAKLVQSTVETGSKYWNQLQRLMDATDRNVTRAKEDIVTMMQSLKDGSSVSTVQLTRAKEVLEDLSRLSVTNSEDWRNMKAQMNEVAQAIEMVAATERSLKGEIASEQDALRLSNALTQESINLRHADGEAAMQAAKKEREGIEATMKGLSDKMAQRSKELDDIRDEIELQEHLDEAIKKRDEKIADARSRKQQAEQVYDEADRFIKAYDAQATKVGELEKEVDELTKEQGKEAKAAEKAAEKAEKHAEAVGKQQEKVSGLEKEVEKLEQDLDTLSKQPVKPTVDTSGVDDAKKKINQEPIKPKVDDSEVKALEARLKAIQDAIAEKRQQIEAESKKGAGSISQWEETLKRVQGSKDGRLTAMGLGDEKKQMDDLLDVANRFYEIIKKAKGVTEDKFIPAQAAEPIKQLAEYYQITEEEARKLIHTLERSDVVQKKFATMRFDEHTGFLAVEQKKGVDDQQIRIEAAQSYLEKAREREAGQTERINKLTGELNDLEQKEAKQKEKIAAASEKAAQAAEQQNEATEKKVKLSKKEQQEVEKLTQDNAALTSTIEALKKQRDALTASDEKGAEAAKEEAQAMKMTAEEAKAALEEMRKMSTLKLKGDTGLEASNIEQAQQYLMGRIKAINPSGVGGGRFTLQGKNQIKNLIDAFKKDYGIGSDKEAREIVSRLVTGKNGGLIQRGVYDMEFGALQVSVDPEALKQRGARMLELTNISKGVTAATKEQTAADQAQEEEVKRLREAYRQEDETLRKRKEEYQKRLDKANAIGGPEEKDGKRTARGQALDDAETYRQRYVVKQEERTKAAWEEYQAVKSGTQATEANTKAKKDNVSVDQQKKQIDEQIAALEQQKAGNTERLTQLQEKGAKAAKKNAEATQEQTQAVKESADAEMTMEELLKRREQLDSKLAEKKKQLEKAQADLEKMTKSETAAEKEQSDVTARLTQKQAEYNEELQKMGPMKEARDQATKDRRNAQRIINRSDETINTTMREVLPERKSEEEMTQMRKKAEDLQKEINDLTQAFDQNAQAITNLNRKETEAAIEMAQSENVSIEKVKQAIELLKKKIETEATDAKTMQERGDAINRLSERLTQMNAEVAKLSQPIADRLKVDDLGTLSETEIRQGIEAAKQLIQTYKSGSNEANELAERIVKAEKHLKETGVEAARQAQRQKDSIELMENQLSKGSALTESALKEQIKYWQQLADDPKAAAEAVKQYTANMNEAQNWLDAKGRVDTQMKARRLSNMDNYSVSELKESIEAAKQMQQTFRLSDDEVKKLSEDIVAAETRISKVSVETERAAQKQRESIELMQTQLSNGSVLTESALKAQIQYWQRLADDPKTAADAVALYTANMEQAQELLKGKLETDIRDKAGRLSSMDSYSVSELKEGIEAAKQMQQTFKLTDDEVKKLSEDIVTAETRISKVSVETERAAQKQRESIEQMETQLSRGTGLTESALKAQESYWRRLADDPKAASNEIARYFENLNKVHELQKEQENSKIIANGLSALERFRGDVDYENKVSDKQLEEDVKALKAYRESLPKEGNLSILREIDYYLGLTGKSAKKASEDVMSLDDALDLAAKAGQKGFVASPEQMQKATKAIEQEREAVIKLIQQKKASNQTTEAEERKLQDLTKKLKDLKFEQDNFNMSQAKMQMLMKNPTNAVNLEELRAAIKRADSELRRMEGSMGKNSKEYKNFAAEVKNAKNVLKEMEGQAKATSSAWDKAWSRLKTYVGMYMGFNMLWSKATGTADDLMTLSDKMGEVRKTTGFTANEVARLSDNLAKLDTRTSIENLLSISARGGQLGLKAQQDIQGFTEAANQLMVALPEMGEESATELMKIASATGDLKRNNDDVRETLERVGSTIIALRANSASAAPAITDFVKRVGAVGAQAGITIDQVAALGSTVDALGGRVEMSATALSRMIPAIRNNAFAVANAIGITEKELKGKTGMEQMVTIFRKLRDSVKGFDMSTEEGMNGAADAVENMLGRSATMQDVMKQLNQQGARAGIVFGLLSQNVDELEKQLGIANNAYSQNVALTNEYNNMNETAAAKWERLNNQIEEFFVNASAESWLSDIIDGLRKLIDIISDEGPIGSFFRYTIAYLTLLKMKWTETIGTALISMGQFLFATQKSTAATVADTTAKTADAAATEAVAVANEEAAAATGKFNKAMKANLVAAVATAVLFLGMKLIETSKKAKEAARQMDVMADVEKKAKEESIKERIELEKLYKVTQDQTNSMEERKKALKDMVGDAKYKEYYSKLSTESELAAAAASAYKELSEQILATARARALDAKAEELQKKRIELEDQKTERKQWENENRGKYRAGKQEYQRQQDYVGSVTGGATAGFQESQIAQRGAAAMKPAIIDEFEGSVKERNRIDTEIGQIDKDLEKLKNQVSKLNIKSDTDNGGGGGGGGGSNPYGNYDKVTSPYSEWNGDDLVKRRKEMLERVRALANGADVQAVLSEDAKFISDAVRKNIKTTEQAIEWYNSERLKIQEALYAKHLTNTGDWLDPKNGAKNWRRMIQNDFDTYLKILDAYYTERKAKIQQSQAEEGLSEAEAQRLTVENETIWRKHRMELQQIYQGKSEKIAKEERQRIYGILAEQDEDTAEMVEKTILQSIQKMQVLEKNGEKGAVEFRKIMSKLTKDIATDLFKQQDAVAKQIDAIRDIIAKERPFNGLAENLQKNLSTMGILFADLDRIRREAIAKGLEPEDDMKQRADQMAKRMMLLLGEAENAYTVTWEQLKEKMKKEGFGDWAAALDVDDQQKQAVIASLHNFYDQVQDAIKKEASLMKKQAEIMWNNILLPDGDGNTTVKDAFEQAIAQLGIAQGRVSRANSLIGAGQASDRVADKLAIKQMKLQLAMQEHYYNLMKKQGKQRIDDLQRQIDLAKEANDLEKAKQLMLDKQHAEMSLRLATTKEQNDLLKQQEDLIAKTEESQNRLYTELKEWGNLLSSSLQSIFEASNAGNADYYNERAKMDLTGKGGPGAGTYVVIDNAGTSDAQAHYEYLDERQALEREHEIEQENARAEALEKAWDDINAKINDVITDQINAMLQNQSIDANTSALNILTAAVNNLAGVMGGTPAEGMGETYNRNAEGFAVDESGQVISPVQPIDVEQSTEQPKSYWPMSEEQKEQIMGWQTELWDNHVAVGTEKLSEMGENLAGLPSIVTNPYSNSQEEADKIKEIEDQKAQAAIDAANRKTQVVVDNASKEVAATTNADKKTKTSTQSSFAAMAAACNMYGLAYQTVTNDNLSSAQKFQLFALQAAGQTAIGMLTTDLFMQQGKAAVELPGILGKAASQLGPIAGPIAFAAMTALLGGLMGLAVSKVAKSKSQISQVTGASVGAGRMATGMLTYGEGNVNEFTDPSTLTPGRQYNVDSADGKTYRARYMGKNAKTHITNGPEFHLVGEKGREAIIDAHTTRQLQMDDNGIWQSIQTLYNGGRLSHSSMRRRGRGVRAFAEGNLDEFEEVESTLGGGDSGMSMEQVISLKESIDRQSDLLEDLRTNGIKATFDVYGKGGLVDSYDTGKKNVTRHGERY